MVHVCYAISWLHIPYQDVLFLALISWYRSAWSV